MRYIVQEPYALRSWRHIPAAYYSREETFARPVPVREWLTLLDCDGGHEIGPSKEIESLLAKGLIRPAEEGEMLSPWQQYRHYDNLYFPQMNWMLTGRCNLNCRHCFNAADLSPLATQWSWPDAERLMDEARDCGIHRVTITGGEPMLHPQFMEILRGIHERGMAVIELNTNGAFLTDQILEEMASFGCRPLMKISFDGVGHHDWLRAAPGAEEKTLAAFRLCIRHGFETAAQINVHRKNVESMLPTLCLLDEMGVSKARIIRTSDSPRWLQMADGQTLSFREYYDRMLDVIRAYVQEPHKMSVRIWQMLDLFSAEKKYRIYAARCGDGDYADSLPVCRSNRSMVAVTSSGEVVPCMQMSGYYEGHGISLGNVRQDGLQKLLQSGPYVEECGCCAGTFRMECAECAACPYFKYCLGGCRALGLAATDDPRGKDPSKCLFFKEGYYGSIVRTLVGWQNTDPIAGLM